MHCRNNMRQLCFCLLRLLFLLGWEKVVLWWSVWFEYRTKYWPIRLTYRSWFIIVLTQGRREEDGKGDGSLGAQLMVLITLNCLFFPWSLGDPCQSLRLLYTTGKLNKENTKSEGKGNIFRIGALYILLLTTPFLLMSNEYRKEQEPHQRLNSGKTSPRWWMGRGVQQEMLLHTII